LGEMFCHWAHFFLKKYGRNDLGAFFKIHPNFT
jgi:hypothetical protein